VHNRIMTIGVAVFVLVVILWARSGG